MTRRQLLRAFEDTDVKAGTLDSAVYRLKDRGLVDKRGGRFGIAESEAAAAGAGAEAGASSPSDRFSAPVGVDVEHGAPQVLRDRRVVPLLCIVLRFEQFRPIGFPMTTTRFPSPCACTKPWLPVLPVRDVLLCVTLASKVSRNLRWTPRCPV